MEISCKNCGAKFKIPDERIPKDRRVSVNCPKCTTKMTITSSGVTEEAQKPAATTEKAGQEAAKPDAGYGYGDDEALGFFEEGVKLALVATNEQKQSERFKQAVKELGYRFVWAKNTREAIGRMRLHHFDLVILDEGFDGIALNQSPVLQFLNHLSMSLRRKTFFAMVGNNLKTMDNMMAFAMSVNLVINKKDIDKLAAVLKKAISENERFYKVFMDALVEEGKA